jgi:hypothetical protein
MEETLFDPSGSPVAYVAYKEEATIYLWDGRPVAYLSDNNTIYGFNGQHLGWFEDGIVWGLDGTRVGYNKKSLPVYAQYEPYKSYKQYRPYRSYKSYASYKPFKSLGNSTMSLNQFLLSSNPQ